MPKTGIFENLYKFSSTLSPTDPSYVDRKADIDLYQALVSGKYCYIFNSRKMGKSSLTVRIQTKLEAEGLVCSRIDLNELGTSVSQKNWYCSLILEIAEQLEIDMNELESWINYQSVTNVGLFRQFIKEILLKKIEKKIVIFIDEIDVVRKLPFPMDDFFAFIRSCHEKRVINTEFERLLFVLIGTATPNQLIQDSKRTPFNIGQAIELNGISLEDNCDPLMVGLEELGVGPKEVLKEILYWTQGQPFLTQKLCYLVAKSQVQIPKALLSAWMRDFIYKNIIDNWENKDEPAFLSSIRDRLINHPDQAYLFRVYSQILKGKPIKANHIPEHDELLLSGLIIIDQQGYLKVANPIYQSIFNEQWIYRIVSANRPYQAEITKWEESNFADTTCLLKGNKLDKAKKWQEGKELDSLDYRFLAVSESLARQKQSRFFMIIFLVIMSLIMGILGRERYETLLISHLYKVPYSHKPELFSQGEQKLFVEKENFHKDQGILAFQKADYAQAKHLFYKAYLALPQDPEALIYYNNAIAHESQNYLTLAVVIPSGQKIKVSQDILKGVAQSQHFFNYHQHKNHQNLFLNIVIINDNNDVKLAKMVAQELVKDKTVMGVIGHYSSESILSALPIYEKSKIPLISPVSALGKIESDHFFKTIVSNEQIAIGLANYATKHNIKKVIIFHNPNQIDSQELTQEFSDAFHKQGGQITKLIDVSSPIDISAEVLSAIFEDQAQGIVLFPNLEMASVVVELYHSLEQLNSTTIPGLKEEITLLGSHSLYEPEILINGGKILDRLVLAVPWFSETVESDHFMKVARLLWREEVNWRTATSYDATQAFVSVINALQTKDKITSKSIQNHLESLHLTPELTSGNTLEFIDEESESNRQPIVVKVESQLEKKLENYLDFSLLTDND